MKKLANELHNTLKDLDYFDYVDTEQEDFNSLLKDLELLKKSSSGALLQAIQLLLERVNED